MPSGATAPEEVPEIQLFANLAIDEGAPPLSYWEGLYDQLKKVGCELDFPEIEERVFNCLVLGPKAMNQAEDGRLLSFAPPPLLFVGTGGIKASVAEELIVVKMHPDFLAHQTGITQALHDLCKPHHKVGLNNYAEFYMSSENIKYIDSGAYRALFHFCNTPIHKVDNLRTLLPSCLILPRSSLRRKAGALYLALRRRQPKEKDSLR
jgi:hypothetical protein